MSGVGRKWWTPLFFLLPLLAVLAIFRLTPTVAALGLAFFQWDGFQEPQFIGIRNFEFMARDPGFRTAVLNLVPVILAVPVWVFLPLIIAIGIHSKLPGWQAFRIMLFVPAVLSPVAIGVAFDILLRPNGPLNLVLRAIGLGDLERSWLVDPGTALLAVIAILIWAGLAVGVAIFAAALGQVDPEVSDAARVDGANWAQLQRHVTLPQVRPVVQFWTILILITVLTGLFAYVFVLTSGGPGYASTVPEFFMYQAAFRSGQFGYASAVAFFLFVIVAVLVAMQLAVFRRRRGEA